MRRVTVSIFILLFIVAFIDASTSQLQMWLISRVAVPEYLAKVGLFFFIVTYAIVTPKRKLPKWIAIAWFIQLATLSVCAFVVYASGLIDLKDQLVNLLVNYLYMMCLPVCILCSKPLLRIDSLLKVLAILAVPLCALGIAQYLLSDPLVATTSADESFRIIAWNSEGGGVRAFSLFASSFAFSCYLALIVGYCVAYLMAEGSIVKVRLLACGGCLLVAFTTYSTTTRLGFLFVAMAGFSAVLLSSERKLNGVVWFCLPLIGLAAAVVTLVLAPVITSNSTSDLVADSSLLERLFSWNAALNTWLNSGTLVFFFGNGISQGSSSAEYVVDNTFLNFVVQTGAFGLLASTGFMYAMWMSLRRITSRKKDPASIAVCAFWTTWMLTGMIDWTNPTYALVAAPLLISMEYRFEQEQADVVIRSYKL